MNDNKNITFEKVQKGLKGKKREDMTAKDVFDRYFEYGTSKELNNPEIQKLLIKHGYVDELTSMVDLITDKKVIQQIFESKLFENKRSM